MVEDTEARYEDILRKISARKPFGQAARESKALAPHDRALNLVNAYDNLRDLSQREFSCIICEGPKTLRGAAWSGVVIWHRDKGYHGYRRLTLLGIWAGYRDDDIWLTLGRRKLDYKAPIYDPGVYRVAIANGFQLYYEDDGRPPDAEDQIWYQAPFVMGDRLRQRLELRDLLSQWLLEMERA